MDASCCPTGSASSTPTRVTITAPVANNSALVIFMVTKADKALALKGVLEGPYEPEQLPSQLMQPQQRKSLFGWWTRPPPASSPPAPRKRNRLTLFERRANSQIVFAFGGFRGFRLGFRSWAGPTPSSAPPGYSR